ncbi:hypothetical protein KMT30_24365 [Streptomyces sp. IBSBF 2953]|uniref:hypothetical protein n=1 Tax=Streptomyces TaxID=1883 RepID=UPI00211A253E|nr:hypothetical protein [Streptomyces scabiei]MCQ9182120.1 hypothetical protein [Streptomyces hayashii]MDX3118201.1 hypothetical protein [Streptomyces scabiei]
MTPETVRPRWWSALRGFVFFLVGGALGAFAYAAVSRRPGGVPWGWVVFGALVCAAVGALSPRRRR